MRYSYCVYYKCIDVVCEIFFFRCVNSISRLYLCLGGTSLSFNSQLDTIFEEKKIENFANKFLLKTIF